jgi:short-subunit dehydrogenase
MSGQPVAAVTGASDGIGRATAWELARRGYRVFALARTEQKLQDLATAARDVQLDVVPLVMDIVDDNSRRQAVEAIMAATDGYGLDVLVNNAGYAQYGAMEEVSPEQLRQQLEVNVVGLLGFTQPFLPGMRRRGRGWIVNVSSAAGRIATPFSGAYNASKFALEGMSDAMRLELAPFGVHVVLIEPGPIHTGFAEAARPSAVNESASSYGAFARRSYGARGSVHRLFRRSAESVARVIGRAVQLNHPRPRYTITVTAKIATVARRLIPDRVTDWVIRRGMGLHR